MASYINIGPAPAEETPVQVGSGNYAVEARKECNKFIALIRKELGMEPVGARLAVKSFPHDFGSYYEVVCYFIEDLPKSVEYAYKCESDDCPPEWPAEMLADHLPDTSPAD